MLGKNLRNAVLGIGIEYKNSFQQFSPVFNSALRKSIKLNKTEDGFYIDGLLYYHFLDKGVSGSLKAKDAYSIFQYNTPFSYKDKKPPISALKEWADAKNINVYAVQNSIFRKGLVPRRIGDKVEVQLQRGRGVDDRLVEGFSKDLDDIFNEEEK
jgi:hypothetical protein